MRVMTTYTIHEKGLSGGAGQEQQVKKYGEYKKRRKKGRGS